MEWWTVVFEVCARQKFHLGKHLEAEFSLVRILSEISRPTDFRNSNFRSANAQIKRCYLRIQKNREGHMNVLVCLVRGTTDIHMATRTVNSKTTPICIYNLKKNHKNTLPPFLLTKF